jgi:hypothetical protein
MPLAFAFCSIWTPKNLFKRMEENSLVLIGNKSKILGHQTLLLKGEINPRCRGLTIWIFRISLNTPEIWYAWMYSCGGTWDNQPTHILRAVGVVCIDECRYRSWVEFLSACQSVFYMGH